MNCEELLLEDYIEGFLSELECKQLEQHVSKCSHCQQELATLQLEQQELKVYLHEAPSMNSQVVPVMQHIQHKRKRKRLWQQVKVAIISAAVLLLAFAMFLFNKPVPEVVAPVEIKEDSLHAESITPVDELATAPEAPFLDVEISDVQERSNGTELTYRVKLNSESQLYYDKVVQMMRARYGVNENYFSSMYSTGITFNLKDAHGKLIASTEPGSGFEIVTNSNRTKVLGEMIAKVTVPRFEKPATFEITSMSKRVPSTADFAIDSNKPQPFVFEGGTYTLESIALKEAKFQYNLASDAPIETHHLTIELALDGKSITTHPPSWYVEVDGQLYRTLGESGYTSQTIVVPELVDVPEHFRLVVQDVNFEEQIEPIELVIE